MAWFCASAQAEVKPRPQPLGFRAEGAEYPSYLTFRDILSSQILSARSRVCVLSTAFEDRELALLLLGMSRGSVMTAVRTNPRSKPAQGNPPRISDEITAFGFQVKELSLTPLNLRSSTLVAIDQQTWAIETPLNETAGGAVTVSASSKTAAEVCQWAQAAQSAKPTTAR